MVVDKFYKGAEGSFQAMTPHKKSIRGVLARDEEATNKKLFNDWILVENISAVLSNSFLCYR